MSIKNRFIVFGALFCSLVALPATAATFEVPRSFEIMYVDLESSSQFGDDFKVDVGEGIHQIVVRFNKLLRSGGDTESYQSEPIVLDLKFEKNTYLRLKAPYISTKKQAESNVNKPQFSIIDDMSGNEVSYHQQMLPAKSGLQNTRDYVAEIEHLMAKNPSNFNTHSTASDSPVPAPVIMDDDVALPMMKFWYNRSDEATRKEMRIWIADNMYKPSVANIQLEMSKFWFNKANKEEKKAFQVWIVQ
ncbi:DUF2057 domain-containing protein [Marinomonas sp. CT5]|uniref:YccT family protein n=1 Tax=Marinomonas sp. CT5 TaxID=2066133 RepID=UPI001833B946|nr:DUF2057 domain-containing protein [Marinomonas sp. CT5]NVK73151.1 DUF2057 domain-containing protein [Oceanospirillaceae bacterium]QUX94819.1 DUF2057 domain-containing protein [Marinomonas sp. CT5]